MDFRCQFWYRGVSAGRTLEATCSYRSLAWRGLKGTPEPHVHGIVWWFLVVRSAAPPEVKNCPCGGKRMS